MRGKLLRTSFLLIMTVLILLTTMLTAEAVHVPGCPRIMTTSTQTKSEETRVGCTIYDYHYKRTVKTCTNPDCGHREVSSWVYTGRTYLRTSHDYDFDKYEYKTETEQSGCSVYAVDYRRTKYSCSRCSASYYTSWSERDSTFSHYSHSYVTDTDTRSTTDRVGCKVYDVTEKRTRKECTRCGATTSWSSWSETSRSFSHYSHLYDQIETDRKTETEQVGCEVYDVNYSRSRQTCSRCGSTTSWSSWKETSRVFSHYNHSYTTEKDTQIRTETVGCNVYSILEERTRQVCSSCGATTSWGSWREISRTEIGFDHDYQYSHSEYDTRETKHGCAVWQESLKKDWYKCSFCGTGYWTEWTIYDQVLLRYEHTYEVVIDTRSREERIGCELWRIHEKKVDQVCSVCGHTSAGSWLETSREYLEPAHDLVPESAEHQYEYEWRGKEFWEIVYRRGVFVCYRCGEIIVEDWTLVAENLLYTDNSPPTVTMSSNYSGGWGGTVVATLTFTDDQTGVKTQEYAWSTGTTTPGSWNTYNSSVTQSAGGIWYLHYRAEDNGGNVETGYFGPFQIDRVAPTGSIDPTSTSAGEWVFKVTATGADEHSGVKRIYYKWTKETGLPEGWESWSYISSSVAELAPPSSGTGWFLQYVIEDNAGNATPRGGGPYNFDLIPPEIISFNPPSAPALCYSIEVVILSQSMGPSGLKETYWVWTLQGDPVPPLEEWTCITQQHRPDNVKTGQNQAGYWILHVAVVNNAGNMATASSSVYRLHSDEVTLHISPTSHPAWTRNPIGVEVRLEKTNAGAGGDDDFWPSIQVVSCWQEIFQDGRRSLKRYTWQSGWYLYTLGVPSNGEWGLDIYALSQAGNTYYPDDGFCSPYRRDTLPPLIDAPVRRYIDYDRVQLQIEIAQWSPTRAESYKVISKEELLDETWQYVWWLQLQDRRSGSTFWVKEDDLPGYGVGDIYFIDGHSKASPYGGAESVWSTSPTPPETGWTTRAQNYTTTKTIGAGEAWYHHVRAWDSCGNIGTATFGPYMRSGSPGNPADPFVDPTANISGPTELQVGQSTTYLFTGTAYHDPEKNSPQFRIADGITNETIAWGGFSGNLYHSRELTFSEPGWYLLHLTVEDSLGKIASASLPITITSADPGDPGEPGNPPDDPPDDAYLSASLSPYMVKHDETLTVYANSSEPNPWVQVRGQIHPMAYVDGRWQAQFPVLKEWPLGINYLAVHNDKDTVILQFQIVKPSTGIPRTRIVN